MEYYFVPWNSAFEQIQYFQKLFLPNKLLIEGTKLPVKTLSQDTELECGTPQGQESIMAHLSSTTNVQPIWNPMHIKMPRLASNGGIGEWGWNQRYK